MAKAVLALSLSSNSITWKAPIESIPEKTVDLDNLARLSSMLPIGIELIELTSFKALKSTHHLMAPPFLGAATKPKFHGLQDFSITPCFNHLSICFLKSPSR